MSWLRYRFEVDHIVGIFDNGKELLIDKEDLEIVSARQWFIDSGGYASTGFQSHRTRLHRLLLSGSIPDGMVVDHINRNKLDNRRSNLRICEQVVNTRNVGLKKNNTSGVPGVFYDKRAHKWRAQISYQGRTKQIGIFDDYEDAVKARKEAEKTYYGGDKDV